MQTVKKAVLPVAGVGTRFLPVTKVVPKELLPIVDKPVIQYLVEEAVESGVEEIIFVISEGKESIIDHFKHHPELESFLHEKEKHDILERIKPIHTLADIKFVYQKEPLGDGHAILQARELIGNEPFVVLFGDDIVKHHTPATKQLLNHFHGEAIMAVEKVPVEKISNYGVIASQSQEGRRHKVGHMVEKPHHTKAPSDLGVIGKYVCPPEIFDAIEKAGMSHGGEKRLIDGFIELSNHQGIWAYEIEGLRFDTGQPAGLIAASQAFLID